jgi:acetyltransferase-like isoleucine patch superfamily enzyme
MIFRKLKMGWHIIKQLWKVNWTKTIYFNFKKFPFSIARKLPVFFYGKVSFTNISGNIQINHPIKTGMIGFGKPYEKFNAYKKIAELNIEGKIIFNGYFQFGKDCQVFVAKNAKLFLGNMASVGSEGKIICTRQISLGDFARIGSESRLVDTNSHQMIDLKTDENFKITETIEMGSHNYIASCVSIMPGTKTPNYCTVAIHSLLNKDYTALGENILIGGIPAKLLREHTTRDWASEANLHEQLKKIY